MTTAATRVLPPPEPVATDRPAAAQPLNAIDRLMRAADGAVRALGASGFEVQTFVWTSGRIDADRLRRAISRLGRLYPVITARLSEPAGEPPRWAFGAFEPELLEVDLDSSDEDAVLRHAADALARPRDPAAQRPIVYARLRRPDGRDVFLLRCNHSLSDFGSTAPLIRRIDRLSDDTRNDDGDVARPADAHRDRIAEYLARFPLRRRIAAALRAIDLRLRVFRGTAVQMGRPVSPTERRELDRPSPYAILHRSLDPDESRALQRQAARTCGFPGVSMAVLAAAFRSLSECAPPERRGGKYVAGVGLDLGLRTRGEPLFQNVCSLMPIGVRAEMLADRTRLIQTLNTQLRDHLERGIDLGVAQLAATVGRRLVQRATHDRLKRGYSLCYACFGSLDRAGDSFCGSPIEHVSCAGPAWPPLGATLIVSQYRGRTDFQVTCHTDSVPAALGERFLDRVLDDLAEFRAAAQ